MGSIAAGPPAVGPLARHACKRFGPDTDWDADRDVGWELYDLTKDFTQARDVAAQHPDKVRELQELWWKEAERNRVLPLMAGFSVLYGILPPLPTQTRFGFAGDVDNIQWGMIPRIFGRSYSIEADLVVPRQAPRASSWPWPTSSAASACGSTSRATCATRTRSWGSRRTSRCPARRSPRGDVNVRMLFEATEHKPGTGGHVSLFINDEQVGEGDMPRTVPVTFTSYSGMDIGRDNGLVVDRAYEDRAPYAFTGHGQATWSSTSSRRPARTSRRSTSTGPCTPSPGCRRLTARCRWPGDDASVEDPWPTAQERRATTWKREGSLPPVGRMGATAP